MHEETMTVGPGDVGSLTEALGEPEVESEIQVQVEGVIIEVQVEQGVIIGFDGIQPKIQYVPVEWDDFETLAHDLTSNADTLIMHALDPGTPYRDHNGSFHVTLPITARVQGDRTGYFRVTIPNAARQPGGNPLPGSGERLAAEPSDPDAARGREAQTSS